MHDKLRLNDSRIPIFLAIESQSGYNGEIIQENIDMDGSTKYDNVHIIADQGREQNKKGSLNERFGVNINIGKQKEMHTIFTNILLYDLMRWHPDIWTTYEADVKMCLFTLLEQLGRYRAPSIGQNVGYLPSMKIREGDSYGAKFQGQRDDMGDCAHGAFLWHSKLMTDPFYRDLRSRTYHVRVTNTYFWFFFVWRVGSKCNHGKMDYLHGKCVFWPTKTLEFRPIGEFKKLRNFRVWYSTIEWMVFRNFLNFPIGWNLNSPPFERCRLISFPVTVSSDIHWDDDVCIASFEFSLQVAEDFIVYVNIGKFQPANQKRWPIFIF